jgi:predicted O-linked N-acetylglucosamine transferase (SPINDLY family)
VQLISRAISLAPAVPKYHCNLGMVYAARGKLDQAIEVYRNGIAQNGVFVLNSADLHFRLGHALFQKGDLAGAIDNYREASFLRTNFPEALNNLGTALLVAKRVEEAIKAFRKAVEAQPDYADAYNNLGNALYTNRQFDEATEAYQRVVDLTPNSPRGYMRLGNLAFDQARHGDAMQYFAKTMALEPANSSHQSSLVCAAHFHPDFDSAAILREQRRWNQQHAAPLKQFIRPHSNTREPNRRIRVGYVSADLCEHVVGKNLLPLLANHDRKSFEVFCYVNTATIDAMTEKFRANCDLWRNILGASDEQAAEIIRGDQIDILVDLTMHLAGNRLTLFARKPAPIQIAFGAYPGGTGVDAMDFRISDPWLDPPDSDGNYVEKTLRLPGSFWCYDPAAMGVAREPAVNPPPALENHFVTFGCLNNSAKVNDGVLLLWSRVLAAVKDSRLLLMTPEGAARRHVLEILQKQGIESSRVEMVGMQSNRDYFRTYQRIDIGLDTQPYNGHTTSLDSFWMGVPVVTLVGKTVVGRAGWSQLCNLNLKELAAQTPEQFVEIAVKLAGDIPRLTELRASLRDRMLKSPLTDAKQFAAGMESIYSKLWRDWCAARESSK